ncbi:hypothetical protein ACTOWA_00075 [Herbaspirillum seropedicae]|uniref:hypothetical protein n=1 Tax=Herbaspirillum seropedicae TaxID=964 RepID=UPI002861AEA3|nr:hypothetical protein [Herbaspirillum seropedicae]MDR6398016.1 hypothetical protein [Herbaspirillum seropedicae]
MTSYVAGQSVSASSHYDADAPVSGVSAGASVGKKLTFDKAELRSRVAAAPVDEATQESLLRAIVNAIRSLIQTVVNIVRSVFGSAPVGGDVPTAVGIPSGMSDMMETPDAITVDDVPTTVKDRLDQVLEALVASSLGENLSESTKAALAQPELNQKQAFRVLLQANSNASKEIETLTAGLRRDILRSFAPFSHQYTIKESEALAIVTADLRMGGSALSKLAFEAGVDRAQVAQLSQADAISDGLAQARSAICAAALSAGVYTKTELRELLSELGMKAGFLNDPAAANDRTAEQAANDSGAARNVFSMDAFRESMRSGDQVAVSIVKEEIQTTEEKLAPVVEAVSEAAPKSENVASAQSLATAIVVADVVEQATSGDLVVEIEGDDFSDMIAKRNRPKAPA